MLFYGFLETEEANILQGRRLSIDVGDGSKRRCD
jgi:hypothetical protein